MKTEELFDTAFVQHQAGKLAEAEALYRQVLAAEPRHPDALHLMGVLALQLGRADVAEQFINSAISIKPAPAYFANLGMALAAAGKQDLAAAAYRRSIQLREDSPQAHNNLANILRQTGKTDEAIASYRRAISFRPDFFEAHNNLGLALCDSGQLDDAITAFEKGISLHPNSASARNNLGIALSRKGEIQQAIGCWQEAISLDPDSADVHVNLGSAFKQLGRSQDAIAAFRKAISLKPNLPEACNNLGVVLFSQGLSVDAIDAYQRAIRARPDFADAHYNLAIALHAQGRRPEAIDSARRAVTFRLAWPQAHNNLGIWLAEEAQFPEALAALDNAILADAQYADAHSNRGNVLKHMGRLTDAVASHHKAISLNPNSAEAHNNLGNALKQINQLEAATDAFRRALQIRGDLPETHNNLGNVLKDQGRLDEAIACYDRALQLKPNDAEADSNRIYTLHFHPDYSAATILAEHQRWNHRHAAALKSQIVPLNDDPSPARRLRIGYVAPDFRDHCQSLFTIPLLSHHDHKQFEIFCYSDVTQPDAITARLRNYADVWRPITTLTDDRVAQLIRDDRIDILIDLTVHMARNRLLVFARKPAPVQATWLGYPGTTGMETMDYRFSDPYLDPPGTDANYSEQTIRLPDSFWCYDPLTNEPKVNDPPAAKTGFITFGCLNNFCKINDSTLRLWAGVLSAVPDSRLLLLAPEGSPRSNVLNLFQSKGIKKSRINFAGRSSRQKYLSLYHNIDIGLDTFPYNGHTTSLDSFWMGVPVITKIGSTAVGRGGYSQLSNLNLIDLAADSDAEFIRVASDLAAATDRLRHLRESLRNRLEQSPLMNAQRFAGNMEAAYRQMWQRSRRAKAA